MSFFRSWGAVSVLAWCALNFLLPGKDPSTDPVFMAGLHEQYRENDINDRQYIHEKYLGILHKLATNDRIRLDTAGTSFEGRPIMALQWGRGPKKVMMWSQMHGDEPTATMAMIDLLTWLTSSNEMSYLIDPLYDSLSILFIPCLNPDGAVRYQRRNAQNIDINRDALELATPEARILVDLFHSFAPNFAFNLHDQSPYYTHEEFGTEIHFSFQVPPINKEDIQTASSIEARQLTGAIIHDMIPLVDYKHFARYPVRYASNAFGEYFQEKGTSTILIESGYDFNDPEKQVLRKHHWVMLIKALERIGFGSYKSATHKETYEDLGDCQISHHDLVVENFSVATKQGTKKADLGLRRIWEACREEGTLRSLSYAGSIGAPYSLKGQHYFNGAAFEYQSIATHPDSIENMEALLSMDLISLGKQGIYSFRLIQGPDTCQIDESFPLMINRMPEGYIREGFPASFIMKRKTGSQGYLVHNGYIHDLDSISPDYVRRFIN